MAENEQTRLLKAKDTARDSSKQQTTFATALLSLIVAFNTNLILKGSFLSSMGLFFAWIFFVCLYHLWIIRPWKGDITVGRNKHTPS